MIISLNWLKKYVDIKIPTDELVELIGSRLVEVEEVIDLTPKYKDCLIVKVVECDKVEGSDHLSLCQVDAGSGELTQVVCGANNVYAGMLAVWLPPKSVVPETYGADDEFVLESRKLMGVISNGMLASARELGLGDDHDGIIEIDPDMAKAGDSFATKFGLDDILLDIENKSLTHRPDCFGVIGFAREVAGILGQKFNEPEFFTAVASVQQLPAQLSAKIVDPELCPRYEAVVLDGFNSDRPKYLSEQDVLLVKSGMRPISPIVDVTNYLMLLTGQPLHAFDYDKLVAIGGKSEPEIIVRAAKSGEKMGLLDGKEITMADGDIVITSNNVPVALAGAMGGANTEIDAGTTRIVIASATFQPYNLRGTHYRHRRTSEAITRFTKGQPPALTEPVLAEAIRLLGENCGMTQTSAVVDAYPVKIENQPIKINEKMVNDLLGTNYSTREIGLTLSNIGFTADCDCGKSEKECKCEFINGYTPWWRTDIHIAEDMIEEVGRLSGFDQITPTLPTRDFTAVEPDKMAELKDKIRAILSAAGANEVLTYSFVHGDLLKKVGQDEKNSYRIVNAISPDLQYYRQTLTPSLLDRSYVNFDDGYEKFALFEINKVTQKRYGLNDEKVPVEKNHLALVLVDEQDGALYYAAKLMVEDLAKSIGLKVRFVPIEDKFKANPIMAMFDPKRSASIRDASSNEALGVVGEFKSSVKRKFKLPSAAGFEIDLERITSADFEKPSDYRTSSRYPSARRDMTFQVGADLPYEKLAELIDHTLWAQPLQYEITPLSIYQGDDRATKNVSFRLSFASMDKTLTGDEIAGVIDEIAKSAAEKLNAKII